MNQTQRKNAQNVMQAFINAGLSQNQARILTAEVGRENGFQSQYLFGGHTDANNNRQNIGLISWQGARKEALLDYMRKNNGLSKNGAILQNQHGLDLQAKFLVNEIRTNKLYEETKRKFLNNPDVDYRTGERVLGKNFIRWDYSGRKINADEHHKRRDNYYQQLGGILPQASNAQSENHSEFSDYHPTHARQNIAYQPKQTQTAQNAINISPQDSLIKKAETKINPLQSWGNLFKNDGKNNDYQALYIQPLEINDDLEQQQIDPYKETISNVFSTGEESYSESMPSYLNDLIQNIYDYA